MRLKHDYLIHKSKTVESFRLVRADISSININIEHIKNILATVESRFFTVENEASGQRHSLDKCVSDINTQQNNVLGINSKIEFINKTLAGFSEAINIFKNQIGNITLRTQTTSKNISGVSSSIKMILDKLNTESSKNRSINSQLVISQKEIKKVKNLLNRKFKGMTKKSLELEVKLNRQRSKMISLNRKLSGKKTVKRLSSRRKVITRKITPRKTITTVKTPKKTVTKTVTPKKKKIVEVIKQGKNPLI